MDGKGQVTQYYLDGCGINVQIEEPSHLSLGAASGIINLLATVRRSTNPEWKFSY